MSVSTEAPCAVQIVHGYNEPFLSLSSLYTRALQQDGWRVTTVYLTGHDSPTVREASCTDSVYFMKASPAQMRGLKFLLACKLRRLLRQEQARLLLCQRYKPLYLGLLASLGSNIPTLGIGHAFGMLNARSRVWWLNRFSSRLLLAGVSRAVTQDMQSQAGKLTCMALPNAIDMDARESCLLSRDAARRVLQLPEDAFVFANVGRLHPDKDQGTLIRAFAAVAPHHPQARLLLIGQGRCETEYRTLAEQLHIEDRVHLAGMVPDAPTLFSAFDAYVSASDREPFGIVLCEAMLAHLPVISTDCGGAPEVLGEDALYFARGNVQQLVAQMLTLLQTPAQTRLQQGDRLYARLCEAFSFNAFRLRVRTAVERVCRHP
jgi:glycosyltransferase involved in cell wall biosynthesis